MDITITLLGRALTVTPGVFGELVEKLCTVTRSVRKEIYDEDGQYVGARYVAEKIAMFWYTGEDPERIFCAYSGYASAVQAALEQAGHTVVVVQKVSDGLEAPQLSRVAGVTWRAGQKEVLAKLLAYRCGIIDCPVGWGKTYVIQQLAKIYPTAEIVITVPFGDVMRQTYESLRVDLGDREVGIVGKGKAKPKRITVCTTQSLHKLPKSVNLVLVDECHAVCTPNFVKKIAQFSRAKVFGFSASPEDRSDNADALATALFGPIIARVGYQEAVEGGNVVPILVWMYRVKKGPNLVGLSDQTYVNRVGIWRNAERNRVIVEAIREIEQQLGPEAQILVMADVFEHVCLLNQLLPDYVMVTGEADPVRCRRLINQGVLLKDQTVCTDEMRTVYRIAFEKGELKKAISTKIWRQGVNFPDLAVLVRADGSGSGVDATQVPGRLARLGRRVEKYQGLLIDFWDEFSDNLKARSAKRRMCYRKHGWRVELR